MKKFTIFLKERVEHLVQLKSKLIEKRVFDGKIIQYGNWFKCKFADDSLKVFFILTADLIALVSFFLPVPC